MTTELLCYSTT